ncbi:unnamed protein product [Phytophthora lilii]|uniref:Unnamed protein product n=1 Tax=Phytophthora lilii TaxID=2077276 RepID=A0A9W6U8A0_9STRA|nr:unnamed protein product [Phytophthora lilii]
MATQVGARSKGPPADAVDVLNDPGKLIEEAGNDAWMNVLAFIRYEAHSRRGAYSNDILRKMDNMFKEAASHAMRPPILRETNVVDPLPKWFIKAYQVELDDYISNGGFGSVHLKNGLGQMSS